MKQSSTAKGDTERTDNEVAEGEAGDFTAKSLNKYWLHYSKKKGSETTTPEETWANVRINTLDRERRCGSLISFGARYFPPAIEVLFVLSSTKTLKFLSPPAF